MTVSHNRQNLSSLDRQAEIELFTASGQLDVVASDEANRQIFSEANVVRLPGGGIDTAASHAKRLANQPLKVGDAARRFNHESRTTAANRRTNGASREI